MADGVVITPSHNPPEDGGFKYNPPHGGPADTDVTRQIQDAANELLARAAARNRARAVRGGERTGTTPRLPLGVRRRAVGGRRPRRDRGLGIRLGVDPLGGASVAYWEAIADRHRLDLEVVNDAGRSDVLVHATRPRREDPHGLLLADAMADLIALKDRFDVAFANDPDADRHGIVTREAGLLNPNHYLAAAISYLFGGVRLDWPEGAGVGKTMVSSSIIDRVVAGLGRRLEEVPVGFKWFVGGLLDGTLGFGGEESAGASFLRRNGSRWSTDKDGLIMCLLAAEMTARTGKDPARVYASSPTATARRPTAASTPRRPPSRSGCWGACRRKA